jgi:hypothetical protein
MQAENSHWQLIYQDYTNAPANALRGRGVTRRRDYVEQDNNLLEIYNSRAQRNPLEYLRSISYRMPQPI